MNQCDSKRRLIERLKREPVLRKNLKPYMHLQEHNSVCLRCHGNIPGIRPQHKCMMRGQIVHHTCLLEPWSSARAPICLACEAVPVDEAEAQVSRKEALIVKTNDQNCEEAVPFDERG